jgi:quinolinate synthase
MSLNFERWATEVRTLAADRDAVILAHNYQVPWIQDVADFVGDSLDLSRRAADTEAPTIVFCGVHFMAETAKILCPDKTVLIPALEAGCSLAASITVDQLREWKAEHPGAVVVTYVNTSAEVKAESDVCCTSANAVEVVRSIPEDREILFLPDMFLGAYVEEVTGRKMQVWMGECHVHAGIGPAEIRSALDANPGSEFMIHPECGCSTACMYLSALGDAPEMKILSTGGMITEAQASSGCWRSSRSALLARACR